MKENMGLRGMFFCRLAPRNRAALRAGNNKPLRGKCPLFPLSGGDLFSFALGLSPARRVVSFPNRGEMAEPERG